MEPRWTASTIYIDQLARLFRSLRLSKAQARVLVTVDGLKANTVAPSRTFGAQLFLAPELFASYKLDVPGAANPGSEAAVLEAEISLAALVHCLQMFMRWSSDEQHASTSSDPASGSGRNAACFLELVPRGAFQLKYASETMSSVCRLTLYEAAEPAPEVPFDVEDVRLQAIMPSGVLADVFKELGAIGTKELALSVQLEPPQLVLASSGDLVAAQYVLPNEPRVIEALLVETELLVRYDFDSLGQAREGLRASNRTSLRVDAGGVLSLQCLCDIDDHVVYLEYRFLPKL